MILVHGPDWKQFVDLEPDGASTALNKLCDGELDAFFVTHGPRSPLLQQAPETVDPNTKKRVFKLADVRPSQKLLELQLYGRAVYATATLESG